MAVQFFKAMLKKICYEHRYKIIPEFTWPNHKLPSDKEAVKKLIEHCGFQHDVAYGKTKIFIRTPRTLFTLEELHAKMLVWVVLFLQKVRGSSENSFKII